MQSINPATNQIIKEYPEHSDDEVRAILSEVDSAQKEWMKTSFAERAKLMKQAARVLRANATEYATIMTQEMGKLLKEAKSEVEKCAWVCEYYADNAEQILSPEEIKTENAKSYVRFDPLGAVLAVMPWNFPFWQVFRFAAPTLMAGNGGVLKHASNVPGCALAIEDVFVKAGFPKNLFRSLLIQPGQVEAVIRHPIIKAVTLTGSEGAGSRVARVAGEVLKKTVLELGGSDPFIVLADADIELAVNGAVTGRLINTGQSCIAAKRFIAQQSIINEFQARLVERFKSLKIGDPTDEATQVGPMARLDLLETLDNQVKKSLAEGGELLAGGKRVRETGAFYEPTIIRVTDENNIIFREETFGPVVALMAAPDDGAAVRLANSSPYGLGASIWTRDPAKAEKLASQIEAGHVAINTIVKSDPRLPFGGVKLSGYGRELSHYGIKEFVNIKTVVVL